MDGTYKNRVRVEFIVGGAMQAYATASTADVIVPIDSREEVEQIPDMPNLVKVPLGRQDTVLSLLERLREAGLEVDELLAEYRQHNVYLGSGMAQDPRLGACAIQDLALRGELAQLFGQVFVRVLEACNAQLDQLVVRELNSNAGGMGAGGGPEVGARFCAYAAQQTSAKIRRQMVRLGGLTYTAVAPRSIGNVGKVTKENVSLMLEKPSAAWELRDMEFYELPLRSEDGAAVRGNRTLRGLLAGTLAQARFTEEVNRLLDRCEANPTLTSQFDGMLRGRAWWSKTLDANLVMRAAASSYRDQLKALRQHPDPADLEVAERVEVELDPRNNPLPPVEKVMAALRTPEGVQSPVLDDFVQAALQTFNSTVWVFSSHAQAGSLHEVLGPPERPPSLEAFRMRCRRLRGLLAHLRQAHEAAQTAQKAMARRFERQRQAMQREVSRLRSVRHTMALLLYSRLRVLRRLQARFEAYQAMHTRYSEACARMESLAAAVTQVEQDLAQYEAQWLKRLEGGLEAIIGKWAVHLDTVVFSPLEAVYSDLIDATLRASIEASNGQDTRAWAVMQPVLLRAVAQVTLQGLAEMLQTTPDPGAMLTAIEDERYAYTAPLWGGMSSYAEPRYRFVVLPPVAANDLAALQRAAKERHFGPTLAMAESVVAGCCIVALAFFPVTKLEEVQPPVYTHGTMSLNGQVHMAAGAAA